MWSKRIRKKRNKYPVLTGNVVKGHDAGYAAFFDEFPEIVAEGGTPKEAKENLIEALKEVLHYRKMSNSKKPTASSAGEINAVIKHFELQIA